MSSAQSQLLSPVDTDDVMPRAIGALTTTGEYNQVHRSVGSPSYQDSPSGEVVAMHQISSSPATSSPMKSQLNFILSSTGSAVQGQNYAVTTMPAAAAAPLKRGRGRPRKHPLPPPAVSGTSSAAANEWPLSVTPPQDKGTTAAPTTILSSGLVPVVKRGRGRPRKVPLDPSLPPVPPRVRVVVPPVPVVPRSARVRKSTAIFSPGGDNRPRKPPAAMSGVRRGRGRPRSTNTSSSPSMSNPHVHRIVRRVRNRLSSMRINMAFVDAYEQTGWRQRSSEKLKPTAELVAVRQKLARHQRALLRELAEFDAVFAMDTPLPTHASELAHDDDIVCSKCQSTLTSDGNDIVLCDCGTCHRAYHQQCLEPVLATLPEESAEWYCPRCDGIFQCLVLLNATFGSTWESLSEVFPELTAHDLEGDTNEMSSDARQTQQDMDEDKASDEDFDKVGVDCLV
ncbi:hypothetical protein, variant [Aphanomyces astaci]|uniref:PHD-type domain-containing protein n=1 Tax=Aphanomyces astaci TaxID=112090 RepID=W4GK80_APHAT|nr:hypothetical protein, variant [Aphanomyces astaci]ETV80090.1 hypothetical protein, variant [Aphanomyces astaci]|eukprot:XP_009830014.1 hypothetical protein, variant [Aphanomyces astaci]